MILSLLIIQLVIALLMIMSNSQPLVVSQFEVFQLQIKQFLIRNPPVSCHITTLTTDEYIIFFDRNRIVKSPGYEILLEDVQDFLIDCSNPITFIIKHQNKDYVIKLGRD